MQFFNIPYEVFIGLRFLRAKRKHAIVSITTLIAIGGIALGVMALIIVLAVMNGFQNDMRDKILDTNAHIVVLSHESQTIKNYKEVMEKIEKVSEVVAVSPFISSQVMLTSSRNAMGVVLMGIDPNIQARVTSLSKIMIEGHVADLSTIGNKEGIIIGKELAVILGVYHGQYITMISPVGRSTPIGSAPMIKKLRVAGIFDSGMYEYDIGKVYIALETAQKLLNMPDIVTGLGIKTKDIFKAQKTADQIQDYLGSSFLTNDWMKMNKNIFSALKLEKIAMFIILLLIIIVAAFNIITNLMMMVLEKYKDIGILKSIGSSSRDILYIFLTEGLIIGIIGTLIGCVSGILICWIADTYHLIRLPIDLIYMNYLPFKMRLLDIIVICIASVIISFLATIYPSWRATTIEPVEVLRY